MLFTKPAELGPTWYLAYLAVFFMAARLLHRVPPAVTMLTFVAAAVLLPLTDLGTTDALVPAAAFFAGLELKRSKFIVGRLHNTSLGKQGTVCVLCALILTPFWAGDMLRDNGFAAPWILCAIVVVLARAKHLFKLFGSRWTASIGINSLAFYLTHWPVMLILRRLNEEFHMFTPGDAFWVLLISSLAVGAATSHFTSRVPVIHALFEPPQQVLNLVHQILSRSLRNSYSMKAGH